MSRFPFLELPHDALKIAVNQMSLDEVVELTTISMVFKKKVETVKYHVNDVQFVLGASQHSVIVVKDDRSLEIEAYCSNNDYNDYVKQKLNGEVVPMTRMCGLGNDLRKKVFTPDEDSKLAILEQITEHLSKILAVSQYSIRCHKNHNFETLFIWKHTTKIENMILDLGLTQKMELSSRNLEFLQDTVYTDKLVWNVVTPPHVMRQKPLTSRKIILRDCSWIDFGTISIDSNTESIHFNLLELPYAGINRIFKEWMSGQGEKLEELYFNCPVDWIRHDDLVLEGITSGAPTIPQKLIRNRGLIDHHDLRPPMEIQRTHDGCVAIVVFHKDCVGLFPWHQKHFEKFGKY